MKSQWHSHGSWGTKVFVPLTIVSLLCFFHTWSYHKPVVPAAVPPLPQPFLPGSWHGLDGHCSGAASLSSCSQKSPAWLWSPAPPKWLFFLCGYRENSLLKGLSYTPDVLQGPVSMELSWKTLFGAMWGCSESRNDPVLRETPLHGAQPVCSTPSISCLAPLKLQFGSGKLSLLLVPSFSCSCS